MIIPSPSTKAAIAMATLILGLVAPGWGQAAARNPYIGYLYPAGGQQGSVVLVTVGGQLLRGAREVHVSGEGVRATVVKYIRPWRNLQPEQRTLLRSRLAELRAKQIAELGLGERRRPGRDRAQRRADRRAKPSEKAKPTEKGKTGVTGKTAKGQKKDTPPQEEVKIPQHPLLHDLESKSLRELDHLEAILSQPRQRQQINRQLAEWALIEVTVDADAAPGEREIRILGNSGLTNPRIFDVGVLPEARELEPNDQVAYVDRPDLPKGKPLELPVLLNGQILPGDVDRFRFQGRPGQQLVIAARARSLIPYLADAVPGWFQATLALYDAAGKEVAFDDDFRFQPDPVLFYRITAYGEYELEIRDAIYRGREDFVYRIAISDQPFITQIFPLGGPAGTRTVAEVSGWNLGESRVALDTDPGGELIRELSLQRGKLVSNVVPYAVGDLAEADEVEPDDDAAGAQTVDLPRIVNGRIERPGDVDIYAVTVDAPGRLVAEVTARRLNSPMDSLLRVTDATGKVLGWNDDHVIKDQYLHKNVAGTQTHHADSHLAVDLPASGTYLVHVSDAQNGGSAAHGYRLRISPPRADFALRVTPSSHFVSAGTNTLLEVHALRQDGFDGEIEVVLADAPPGFELHGGRIPPGSDRVRMTLRTPAQAGGQVISLKLEGRAHADGRDLARPAVPADDVMQAFLYRHLVPARELVVAVQRTRWGSAQARVVSGLPIRIPLGGVATVRIETARGISIKNLDLELQDPPPGVSLVDISGAPKGVTFRVAADSETAQVGHGDNLIVRAFREYVPRNKKGKPTGKRRRAPIGYLPAIPIEIVAPSPQ